MQNIARYRKIALSVEPLVEQFFVRLTDIPRMSSIREVGDLLPGFGHVFGGKSVGDAERSALSTLPAELGDEAGANLEQAAGLGAVLIAELDDQRRHILGLEQVYHLL